MAWALVVAAQLAPFMGLDVAWLDLWPERTASLNAGQAPAVALWMALWQVVKVVPTLGRMHDLGRAADDAVFGTLVPVANFYLFFSVCLKPTPAPKRWERLARRHRGQPTWYNSGLPALGLMARTGPVGVLLLLALCVPAGVLLDAAEGLVPYLQSMDAAERSTLGSGVTGLAAFLTLYSLLQLRKRETANPASWIPTVLWLPAWLLAGLFAAMESANFGTLGPLLLSLVVYPLSFVWYSFVGTAVVLGWTAAFDAAHHQRAVSLDAVGSAVRGRYLDVLGAYAARVQLVWLGAQVVVPGLFYWVYTAFVPMVGLLEDPVQHPLTTRSGALTWGMMSRLVKLCLVYAVMLTLIPLLVLAGLMGWAVIPEVVMGNTAAIPTSYQVAFEVLAGVFLWWSTAVLYLMYKARVVQLDELRAERDASKNTAAVEASGASA